MQFTSFMILNLGFKNPFTVRSLVLLLKPLERMQSSQGCPWRRGKADRRRGDGRTPVCERLGLGFNSPSFDWRGLLERKRLRRWPAARRAADGHGVRDSGEQAGQPANAHAHEGSWGVVGA
jgi:hypothetical protein